MAGSRDYQKQHHVVAMQLQLKRSMKLEDVLFTVNYQQCLNQSASVSINTTRNADTPQS
jgi:hypothetical protein